MGIKGGYVHFAVRPDEADYAFRSLKRTTISGVNVTLPLKKLAFHAADERTPDAQKLGVANCLYKRADKLIAHNTDLEGFAAPLLKSLGTNAIMNTPAFVIGTGGAARAVIGALLALSSPEIRLCGRTDSKTEALANEIGLPSLYSVPWIQRNTALSGAGLIINASAGGMRGKPELDIDLERASEGAFVYDLIYTPLETALIKSAKQRNLRHIGGLDMLIAQARPSFKFFYGQTPPDALDPTNILTKTLSAK
jgi:shikimate dehydrogenase